RPRPARAQRGRPRLPQGRGPGRAPSRPAGRRRRGGPRRQRPRACGRGPRRVLREGDDRLARARLRDGGQPNDRGLRGSGPRARMIALVLALAAAGAAALPWPSPMHHRLLLRVEPGTAPRSHSPASVDVDFAAELATAGERGTFDEATVEVIAYDDKGAPRVFDARREGRERLLLPWRIDREYPLSTVHLHFVLPDARARRLAVY